MLRSNYFCLGSTDKTVVLISSEAVRVFLEELIETGFSRMIGI